MGVKFIFCMLLALVLIFVSGVKCMFRDDILSIVSGMIPAVLGSVILFYL